MGVFSSTFLHLIGSGRNAGAALPVDVAVVDAAGNHVTSFGSGLVAVSRWRKNHFPATNTKATITQAAPGAGFKNVLTGWTAMYVAQANAPVAKGLSVAVIDGVAGGTAYLDGPHALGIPAVAGATNGIARDSLLIVGSENTATTIEFTVSGGADTQESVSMEGIVVAV